MSIYDLLKKKTFYRLKAWYNLCQYVINMSQAYGTVSNILSWISYFHLYGQHEKFTSQLQITKKPSPSVETTKSPEVKGAEGGTDAEARPSETPPKPEEKEPGE